MRDAIATAGDHDLIQRSLAEPECFAALFDRHAPHLHAYVARRLGPDVADDVVSDTFLDAFRRRHVYDPRHTDARPWLYGIASNLVGKHRRRETARYRAYARTGPDETIAALVEEGVTTLAVNRPLLRALASLKPGDRDVLLLVAWAQFTYGEVALALSIPVGTVRSRLNRARAKVKTALEAPDA
ncbi:RNA polymerase sigma factor [Herbidospora mongoliensis]|uniref:RNA polymerase sigma factor n=1 Tax=Herbidospora mongoliensis TaxID=688067 RepID=UPI0008375448|nr:RNA polymerase sigma factor [Herbidospora mongoliensis]